MQDAKFPPKRKLIIAMGFVFGIVHVLIMLMLATTFGHGDGNEALVAGPLFFGAAQLLWFVLPPFQYALYADVAFRRKRKLGIVLAALHYGSGILVFLFYMIFSNLRLAFPSGAWPSWVLDVVVCYGLFFALNAVYFRRLLSQGKT